MYKRQGIVDKVSGGVNYNGDYNGEIMLNNNNDNELSANENINNGGIVDKVSGGVNVGEDYIGEIMLNKNNGDIVENGAVSYTHLDVYKRQTQYNHKLLIFLNSVYISYLRKYIEHL